MANTSNARGLAPYQGAGGTPRLKKYKASTTTATYRGDVVALNASGVVHPIATTTGSAKIVGVAANYVAAGGSTNGDVWVWDDPDQQFLITDDGLAATPSQVYVGSTFALIVGAGNTTTFQSNMTLDASSTGVSATQPLLVQGFVTGPTLAIDKYATEIVMLNRHIYKKGSTGV